jgi:two-component system KDP operon response regulator KdpE
MTERNTILVVEDDEQLLRMLQSILSQSGYAVVSASSGMAALEQLVRQEVDAVLLDLGLPDMDGKEVIRQAHAISDAPMLVISARGSEKEKIAALDLGANDYVAKPFDAGELLARLRVALRLARRVDATCAAAGAPLSDKLQIDFDTRRVIIEGRAVRLSRKEIELVRILASANGAAVSQDRIVEQIWGPTSDTDHMNLRVLAWQVRRKIEPNMAVPQYLIAEAGEGYRLKTD